MTHTKTPAVLLTLALALTLGACQTEPADTSPPAPESVDNAGKDGAATPDDSLPDAIERGSNEAIAWEALMGPDGEYAAAAHYQAVLDVYGDVEPYKTIKASEDRHIAALIRQLDRYGIEAPDNPFTGTISAPADLETAAREWAIGEVANVEMYDRLIAAATDDRLIGVLDNLRTASRDQHLPAFEEAALNGGTLDPSMMGGTGRN